MWSFVLGFGAGVLFMSPVGDFLTLYKTVGNYTQGSTLLAILKIAVDQGLLRAEQALRRSVVPSEKGHYKVSYFIRGELYEIDVRPVRGPHASRYTPEERGKLSISGAK